MNAAEASKVVFVLGRARPSGPPGLALNLARGLAAEGVEVRLLCKYVELAKPQAEAGLTISTWAEVAGVNTLYYSRRRMRRLLERWGTEIIHLHGQDVGRLGERLVHGADVPYVLSAYPTRRHDRALGHLHARAERVVAVNENAREELVNEYGIAKQKIVLVPPGVDVAAAAPRPPLSGETAPVVGMPGPLDDAPAQRHFLEAVRTLLDRGVHAQFLIVGEGPAEPALRAAARELGVTAAVSFIDRVEDYRQVMPWMDIVVCPNPTDELSYTIMQAMAMGKAVVSADAGGIYDLVRDGKTGRLVAKDDAEALAAATFELIAQPERARELGRGARDHVDGAYPLRRAVRRLRDLYGRILRERALALAEA